ncbi:MAG TPA: glycosyltransferase family protein [Chitinophagaceae bacterium]|nr:glycosyltransferase family protein [Chitinophagaceae bacterium]
MKIFYAVQATGNGHISRAMQLLPYLRRYGQVDIFLSGSNSQLNVDAPVRFRSKGLSLYYNHGGGLDYWKIASAVNPVHVWDELRELPVENYDVVINDFECITSLACAYKKVASVNFGHQASFHSPLAPRPKRKQLMGELILKNYARATQYLGLHFEQYDNFIFTPVIKKEVLQAKPVTKNHITVYLSAYSDETVFNYLKTIKGFHFHVFSKQVSKAATSENVTFIPVSDRLFTESMISSAGVITGAGFETPAEALQLKKKLLVIPIRGQYEQLCNAAALEGMGVTILDKMDDSFAAAFDKWMQTDEQKAVEYSHTAPKVVDHLFENYPYKGESLDLLYPNLIFN